MDDRPSLMRELAHELRDALSPIRAAIDLLRLRNFDTEVSRRVAEKVDRGLDAALAAVDAFVAADQSESGTLTVAVARISLDQIVEAARTALAPLLAGRAQRCEFPPPPRPVEALADAAKSLRVIRAMLEQASAVAPPRSVIEVRAADGDSGPQIRVRFSIETPDPVAEHWFESYGARARGSRMALRTTVEAAPDVALIDIHLPGMNGYRLAQALKARASPNMRLVMLSGMTLDDTTLRLSRDAGFDDCIDKAAGPKALHALLQTPS